MPRTVFAPHAGATIVDRLKNYNGGTGGITVAEADTNFNVALKSKYGIANGIAWLDGNTLIPLSHLPNSLKTRSTVQGPTSLNISSQGQYIITDYDSFDAYTVVANGGSVTRSGEIITYIAPATIPANDIGGFSINGVPVNITITGPMVTQPVVTSPVNNAVDLNDAVTITSSAFLTTGQSDTHQSSSWQLATDSEFVNIISQVTNSTTNKTSWTVNNLAPNTAYYVRVAHKGVALAQSDWSPVSKFTTRLNFVPVTEVGIFSVADKAAGDLYGYQVSISGDGTRLAISNLWGSSGAVVDCGKVYVYVYSGISWAQEAILTASDKATNSQYGFSVAISADGTRIVVGASHALPDALTESGAAYVYSRSGSTWSQETILFASDKVALDAFGTSVDIDDTGVRVAIGAIGADPGTLDAAGKVYIFSRAGAIWTEEAILTASDQAAGDLFGNSVKLTGDANRIIIGAPNKTVNTETNHGQAYVFLRLGTAWTEEAIVNDLVTADLQNFGSSVSITETGDRAIIGAHNSTVSALSNAGLVYVFSQANAVWTQEAILQASVPEASAVFGQSVDISSDGKIAVVGAPLADPATIVDAGSTYIFLRNGLVWTQEAILTASDKLTTDRFGFSVAISSAGRDLIVSSPYGDVSGLADAGKAYLFI